VCNVTIMFAASAMLIMINQNPENIYVVVIGLFVITVCVGILYTLLTVTAMDNVVSYTGLSASLLGCSRFSCAAITSAIMGAVIHTTAAPLAVVIFILNGITFVLMHINKKNARDLNLHHNAI